MTANDARTDTEERGSNCDTARLTQYRAVAARYGKLTRNFQSMIAMAWYICGLPYEYQKNFAKPSAVSTETGLTDFAG